MEHGATWNTQQLGDRAGDRISYIAGLCLILVSYAVDKSVMNCEYLNCEKCTIWTSALVTL